MGGGGGRGDRVGDGRRYTYFKQGTIK